MVGRRTQGLVVGLALGLALGAVALWAVPKRYLPTSALGMRDRLWRFQQARDREFLDVPEGRLHLRSVPLRTLTTPGSAGRPGTLDTYPDAVHEFFREDSRPWLLHMVELAVPEPGVLTVDVVDRPGRASSDEPVIARLEADVHQGQPLLVGFGVEGLGQAPMRLGDRVMRPGEDAVTPPRQSWPPVRQHRLRLLIGGGKPVGGNGTVLARHYTSTLTSSAWGPTCSIEHAFSDETMSSFGALKPEWINGPALMSGGFVSGGLDTPGLLGVLLWAPSKGGTPRGSHSSWTNGRIREERSMGDVQAVRTNSDITLRVQGRPTALDDYPYPAWVLRVRFDPGAH